MRGFLSLAVAGMIGFLELPGLWRRRMLGEFWAVVAILAVSAGFGMIVAGNLETPSLASVLIAVFQPFGEMMVGP